MASRIGKFASILLVFLAVAVGVSTAQTLATVTTFAGANGSNPHSSLIQGTDGNFYGTTYYGGFSNDGIIYRITPGGALTFLHSFSGPDGARLWAGLVQGTDGNFYGTTVLGGLGGGTVFKMDSAGVITTLYQFGGSGGTLPYGGVIQGSDGNFYGTTYQGGTNNKGTIFQITPSGTLTTIYNFAGPDGASPWAGLVQGTDGNFYGTTYQGGTNNLGTVFVITSTGTLTTLYSFAGTDGSNPYGPLVQGTTDGNFYGTTSLGGTNNNGTVFQITTAGALTSLHSFCSPTNCGDGSIPFAGLVQAPDGSFYGTASSGGTHGLGVVFNITSTGTLTTTHSFNGADGSSPYASLMLASNGDFYGTTYKGGANNDGTIFAVSPTPFQFVPVPPCRLVDTRQGSPIQGGTASTFDLKQLAQNNGCADLSTASSYSLNVTLVPINGGPVSYLTIWPTGQAQPGVSTMNSLDGRVKADAAIVPGGTNGEVNVFATNTTNVLLDINGYFAPVSQSTLTFYPLTPCRVADTRNPDGPLGGPFLSGGQERDFPMLASSCHIPASAQAYSLNFTVVPYNGESLDYLTVWPAGQTKPIVSTLNNPTTTIVANAAVVGQGTSSQIAVYPSQDTQLVVDINGYFAPAGSGGLSMYPVTPCRVLDTRTHNGQPFSGTLNPPVDVVDSNCAISPAAQAYVFNATVVPSPILGYLTLWAYGKQQPVVSTLNAPDGSITSNMAIVPEFNGKINAFASGTTQLILDISSYFAP
jgi:uncharacterized repeat protein (TIGR03803 family)